MGDNVEDVAGDRVENWQTVDLVKAELPNGIKQTSIGADRYQVLQPIVDDEI